MNYKELLFDTLEKLGTSKTNLGYDYIVYGLLLMEEDPHCISCITKFLYIDIANHYGTTWKCVEKNIRNSILTIWVPSNDRMLKKKSSAEAVLTTDLQIKNFLSILMNILIQ